MLCAFKYPTTSSNGNPPSPRPRRSSLAPDINPKPRSEFPESISSTISPLTPEPRRHQATGSPRPPSAAVSAVTHGSLRPGRRRPPAARLPHRDESRGAQYKPPPLSRPYSGCNARTSCPTPGPGPTTRRREGVPRTAQRRPDCKHHPSPPRGCWTEPAPLRPLPRRGDGHDSTNSAAARGPRGPRGRGGASSLGRSRQSQNGGSTWRRGGSGGAGRGLLPSSPSQRAPLPLGIHFPEKPVSPAPPSPSSLHNCH